MKVDVIQVEEAKFKRLRWWSNWVDVAVFNYDCKPFLLQMRISRTNKKQFSAVCMTGKFLYRQSTVQEIGDLTPMAKPLPAGNV